MILIRFVALAYFVTVPSLLTAPSLSKAPSPFSTVYAQPPQLSPEAGALLSSAESGDTAKITELLDKDPALLRVADDGKATALHRAFRNNNAGYDKLVSTVTLLLARGAEPNVQDSHGLTPLHLAASSLSTGNAEALAALLAQGADVNARDRRGSTPLHRAANAALAKLLIGSGADVKAADTMGNTPLHTAKPDVVPLLLAAGADANLHNARGDTPLHISLRAAYPGAPPELIAKSDLNAQDRFGLTAVQMVLLAGNRALRDLMMARQPVLDEVTRVCDVAAQNDSAQLKALLEAKAHPNGKAHLVMARLPDGSTPLHLAAKWLAPATAALLLERGADPNARNAEAATPLHEAMQRVEKEKSAVVRDLAALLLDKGADINLVNGSGNAPLHQAFYVGDKELFTLLLERGADPNLRGGLRGATPLHMVVTETHINEIRQEVAELLLAKGAALDAFGSNDPNYGGSDRPGGLTPLTLTIARLSYDNGRSLPLLEFFLNKGASLTIVDDAGNNPLGIAVQYGRKDVVVLLLEKGAAVNARNLAGETPLALARRTKREEIATLLRQKGAQEPDEKSEDKQGDK